VASAFSFFVCFFVYGLAGGFDAALLVDLRSATEMTSFARPIAQVLCRLAHLGAGSSPLAFARTPPALVAEAAGEAAELDRAAEAALARTHARELPAAAG
jgi:hypothetical protein